jgi:hypothetical protein
LDMVQQIKEEYQKNKTKKYKTGKWNEMELKKMTLLL